MSSSTSGPSGLPLGRYRGVLAVALIGLVVLALAPAATSVHLYRGPGSGCSPASGEITDSPDGEHGEVNGTVMALHNTFNDQATLTPVTRIQAGEAVRWVWNSEHCHSIQSTDDGDDEGFLFYSGFHYPAEEPSTPELAPGVFHYPVPTLEEPTLSYVHTFEEPGTYTYVCEHHGAIGMVGIVIVE